MKLIGGSFGVAVVLLVGSMLLAIASGLASGATEPAGLWFTIVMAMLIGYDLALVVVGVGGIWLCCDLSR